MYIHIMNLIRVSHVWLIKYILHVIIGKRLKIIIF